jgi:hypothetical protein
MVVMAADHAHSQGRQQDPVKGRKRTLSVLLGDQALNRDSARWCQGHLMVGQERAGLVLEQPAPVHGVPGTGVVVCCDRSRSLPH